MTKQEESLDIIYLSSRQAAFKHTNLYRRVYRLPASISLHSRFLGACPSIKNAALKVIDLYLS